MANIIKQPCDEGVIESAPCVKPCTKIIGRWVLAATILGSSMAFVDGTVVNVALPALQEQFNATVTDVQWVIESYALMIAALLLVGGSLGDHFGRRRIFAAGIAIFTAASAWCGFVPNVEQLIFARAIQGVGGALLVPGSLAIISATFDKEHRGHAIGTWSAFTAITMAMGPVFGGWLIENVSWRWIFFINIPLAIAVLAILYWRVPESKDETKTGGLDWWGAFLVTFGLGTIVYGLIESANLGLTNPIVMIAIISGAIALVVFFLVEARSTSPMMPLALFKSKSFSGANVLTLFLYGALSAVLFFLPFNLIQVQGYTATQAGAAFLPLVLILFLLSRWAGGLIRRHGAKLPLTIGPIIAAIGYVLFTLPEIGGSYWTTFFPAVTVLGLGMAISVAPLTTTVMGAVDVSKSGIASGINNAVSRIAGLLAIAILGIVVFTTFSHNLDQRLTKLNIPKAVKINIQNQTIKLAAIEIPSTLNPTMRMSLQETIHRSFITSFRLVSYIAVILSLLSALSAWLWIEGRET